MVDMALTWQKTHYVNNTENSKNFEDIYRKHLQVLRREPNVIFFFFFYFKFNFIKKIKKI